MTEEILMWVERRGVGGEPVHCLVNQYEVSLGWVYPVGEGSIGRTQRTSVLLNAFRPPVEDMKAAVWDQVQKEIAAWG